MMGPGDHQRTAVKLLALLSRPICPSPTGTKVSALLFIPSANRQVEKQRECYEVDYSFRDTTPRIVECKLEVRKGLFVAIR